MGSEPGYPFQGDIYYEIESTYSGGFIGTHIARISDKVLDVRLDSGDVHRTLRGISEPTVCGFVATGGDHTLHIEWIYQPQSESSLATVCCNRTNGDLQSIAFEIAASKDRTNKSYYVLEGCKCKTFTFSGRRGEEYIATADFSVQSVVTSSSASQTPPPAIGNDYAGFNSAGSITFTGGYTAYITDSIDITVDNNLVDYYNVGSNTKLCAIPGAKDVTGSADLSLDEGGANAWYHVADNLSDITNLVISTGCTGTDDTITLTTGKYDNISVDLNIDGGAMMGSIPFTFKQISFA